MPEKIRCTTLSAWWCPICGDCTCKEYELGIYSEECPLHGEDSIHGEDNDDK